MIEGLGAFGQVAGLQRSGGGVPKLPIERATVLLTGIEGDWQRNRKFHGGPDRALCLYSLELLDALVREGHPAGAGRMGENVTISGIDWRLMQFGTRVRIGRVEAEVTAFAAPCRSIAGAFLGGEFTRVSEKVYPGWSRVYAKVLREGEIAIGNAVEIL